MKTLFSKKFIAFLLAVLLVMTSLSISVATAETEGDYEYSVVTEYDADFNAIKSIKITGYTGNDAEVIIPDAIAELPVTAIEDNAFAENKTITSVTVPETVIEIGSWAFEDCENLAEINLPSTLERISGNTFKNTAFELDSNNWDSEFLYIDNYLLKGSDQITGDVIIKDGTKIIADFAFNYNENITSVTIPSSVKSIGIYAFTECTNLSSVSFNEGLEVISSGAFEYTAIDEITIPNSVKSIDSWAFSCTNIESFNVTANVESLSGNAFSGCTSLKAITVDSNNKYFYSVDGILFEKSEFSFLGDTLAVYPSSKEGESYTIPDNVQYLGYNAFEELVYLKELNIPAIMTYLTLSSSSNLEKINVAEGNEDYKSVDGVVYSKDGNTLLFYPNGATAETYEVLSSAKKAEYYAVVNNAHIKELTLPEGFETLDEYTIYSCENLKTINLPSTLNKLGNNFVRNCPNLTAINFNGTMAQWNAFDIEVSTQSSEGLFVYCTDGEIELVAPYEPEEDPTEGNTGTTPPEFTEPTGTAPTGTASTDPTETTTADKNTEATVPEDKFDLGDVNMDSKLNIRDATAIQKHLAKIVALSDDALTYADFTQDGKVNIKDATNIQKKIAGII